MSTTKEVRANMTPQEALERLVEGNKRFAAGHVVTQNIAARIAETAGGQSPFAAILGCIDSRVPAEQVFDQGIGDLFNARVAGNIANEDILGSIEYACGVVGSKLVLVLGHTACGAVTAATQGVEMGNITALLSKITPVVEMAGEGTPVDDVATQNVRYTMERIRKESDILRDLEAEGKIAIKGAMYDVTTGKVDFLD